MEKFYLAAQKIEEIFEKHHLMLKITETKGAFVKDYEGRYRLKMDYLEEKLKTTSASSSPFLQAMEEVLLVLEEFNLSFRELLKSGLYLEDETGKGQSYLKLVQYIRENNSIPPLEDLLGTEEKYQLLKELMAKKMELSYSEEIEDKQMWNVLVSHFYRKFETLAAPTTTNTKLRFPTQNKYEQCIQFLVKHLKLTSTEAEDKELVRELFIDSMFRERKKEIEQIRMEN